MKNQYNAKQQSNIMILGKVIYNKWQYIYIINGRVYI